MVYFETVINFQTHLVFNMAETIRNQRLQIEIVTVKPAHS